MAIVLYSYYRSSASYRLRIALNLKGIEYDIRPVHLLQHGGDQHHADYLAVNPQGLVPTLLDGNNVLIQSAAIIEYLEEVYPEPPLLPGDPVQRAYVRSLAQLIACDIHPLNNLRVLKYLKQGFSDDAQQNWYEHWIWQGFSAFENLLRSHNSDSDYCHGDRPGLADIFLIPQVYNALRFKCGLKSFPLISSIYQHCLKEVAFSSAAPENQVGANSPSK